MAAGAVIGGIIGGTSGALGIGSANRAKIDAFKKQMRYAMQNYNINQQQLTKQEQSAYNVAIADLFNLSVNALQNNSAVEAALNETGYEGRTAGQTKRTLSGTTLRQKTAVKDTYEEDVVQIRSKKDALYIQMKASVEQARENLDASFTKGFSSFMSILDSTAKGAVIGAATAGAGSAFFGGATGAAAGAGAGATTGAGASAAAGTTGATVGSTVATTGAGSTASVMTLGGTGTAASSGASSGFSFANGIAGFNQWYTQYGSYFKNLYSATNVISSGTQRRQYYGGYYY